MVNVWAMRKSCPRQTSGTDAKDREKRDDRTAAASAYSLYNIEGKITEC